MPWRSPARGAYSGVGIYDRDYYREAERPGAFLYTSGSVVTKIIVVNVVVWVADFLVTAVLPQHGLGSAITWRFTSTRFSSRGSGGST